MWPKLRVDKPSTTTTDLKEATEHFLMSDGSFYTLTYSPQNLLFRQQMAQDSRYRRWASYHLSYRSGYFADGNVREKDQGTKTRTRLLGQEKSLK